MIMFKELEKFGYVLTSYDLYQRTGNKSYDFYDNDLETSITVTVSEEFGVYYQFPNNEDISHDLLVALTQIDWKGVEF